MGFIALKCPSCGASIELDENREFGFCSYCGTKVMQDKKIVELKGEVKVEGVSTADKLLERAYILIEDNEFNEAEGYFNRVLELDPKCDKAYWGKMLCEYRLFSADEAVKLGIDISKSNNYSRAVQYADGEQKKQYIEFGEKAARVCSENFNRENEIRKKNILKYTLLKIYLFVAPILSFVLNMATHQSNVNAVVKLLIFILALFWFVAIFAVKKFGKIISKDSSQISKMWTVIAAFLFIFAMFLPYNNDSSDDTTDGTAGTSVVTTTEPTTESPIEISATKLVKAYIDNEVKADTMYEDKTVIVSGYVDRIGQTNNMIFENEIIVYVGSGDSMESCLRCYVSMDQKDVVANLDVGDKITVTGRCTGLGSSYFNFKCVNIYDSVISE